MWWNTMTETIERLREVYRRREDAKGLLLQSPHSIAWLLGERVQVGITGSAAVCEVLIVDQGVYLLANNIEAARLRDVLRGAAGLELVEYPWDHFFARHENVCSICPEGLLAEADCEEEIQALRLTLNHTQAEALEEVCRAAAGVVADCCGLVQPGMTDYEIAGMVANGVYQAGLEPIVLLTICDGRNRRYRHPVPAGDRLERYAMLSLGARRNGLYASVTRFVSFGEPEAGLVRAKTGAQKAMAMLAAETRPGKTGGELFAMLRDCYAESGCPGEEKLHHQGGLGGFQVREDKITAAGERAVEAGQVYAWNPSVTGFKCEDTLLVGPETNRILTATPSFPCDEVEYGGRTWQVPGILAR